MKKEPIIIQIECCQFEIDNHEDTDIIQAEFERELAHFEFDWTCYLDKVFDELDYEELLKCSFIRFNFFGNFFVLEVPMSVRHNEVDFEEYLENTFFCCTRGLIKNLEYPDFIF